jgi:hypothetical protein
MKPSRVATGGEATAIGLLAVGIGVYFSLVGLGLLPVPSGTRNLHAPLWIVLGCGLAFGLGGVVVLLQRVVRADLASGELPAQAPRWLHYAQYLFGVAIFAIFAVIGSWVAFGPGARTFSGTVPAGPAVGRILFGIGAIICWLSTIAFAVAGFRKLRRPPGGAVTAASRPASPLAQSRRRIVYALGNKPK